MAIETIHKLRAAGMDEAFISNITGKSIEELASII